MEKNLDINTLIQDKRFAGDSALSNCYSENVANLSLIFWVSSRSFNQYSRIMYIQDCLKGNKIQRCTGLSTLKRTVCFYLRFCTCVLRE
jgi:hypothetical protein